MQYIPYKPGRLLLYKETPRSRIRSGFYVIIHIDKESGFLYICRFLKNNTLLRGEDGRYVLEMLRYKRNTAISLSCIRFKLNKLFIPKIEKNVQSPK